VTTDDVHLEGDGHVVLGWDILKEILLRKGLTVPTPDFDLRYSIGLLGYTRADAAQITVSSGVDVATWSGIIGYGWNGGPGSFTEPEFDSTEFGGLGGIKTVGIIDSLESDTFSASAVQTVFMALSYPTVTQTSTFFMVGDKLTGLLAVLANGNRRYRFNEASSNPPLEVGGGAGKHLYGLEYTSTSDCVATDDNSEMFGGTFDPDDGYSTNTKHILFGFSGSTNQPGIVQRSFLHADVIFLSDLRTHVLTEIARDANITLP
jgi:hypothetical protein